MKLIRQLLESANVEDLASKKARLIAMIDVDNSGMYSRHALEAHREFLEGATSNEDIESYFANTDYFNLEAIADPAWTAERFATPQKDSDAPPDSELTQDEFDDLPETYQDELIDPLDSGDDWLGDDQA